MACCSCNKNCCNFGILFSGFFCLAFHIFLIGLIDLKLNRKLAIKNYIFSEKPLYGISFSKYYTIEKLYYQSFYEFDGKIKENYNVHSEIIRIETIEKKDISIIYGNYFYYKTDDRTYYDYMKDYSVVEGENCKKIIKNAEY